MPLTLSIVELCVKAGTLGEAPLKVTTVGGPGMWSSLSPGPVPPDVVNFSGTKTYCGIAVTIVPSASFRPKLCGTIVSVKCVSDFGLGSALVNFQANSVD